MKKILIEGTAAYRIVKRGIELKIARGESVEEAVSYYTKFTPEQMDELIKEYKGE